MIKKIDHVAIAVNSLEEKIPYFRDVLKFELLRVNTVEAAKCRVAMFSCGNACIELVEGLDETAGASRHIAKYGEGLYHIAFEVDDLDKTREELKNGDIALRNEAHRAGSNGSLINYIDPQGANCITCELMQKH